MAHDRVLGIPSPRVEGEEKVGGKAIYAVDVMLPGMLWVKVVRSPIAHGKINRIDVSKARDVPEVRAILTGQDLAGIRIGKKVVDMPILADGVVRYIGEKVAAVAADFASRLQGGVPAYVLAGFSPSFFKPYPQFGSLWGLDNTGQRQHQPRLAHDGVEALEALERERFDLVLMDVQMPRMDGFEATRRLRAAGVDLPIIALTAHAMKDDEARCLAAGMNGYLTKPFTASGLRAVIEQVLVPSAPGPSA